MAIVLPGFGRMYHGDGVLKAPFFKLDEIQPSFTVLVFGNT